MRMAALDKSISSSGTSDETLTGAIGLVGAEKVRSASLSEGSLFSSGAATRRIKKLEDWLPPTSGGTIVSQRNVVEQLASLKKVVEAISKEMEEHDSYRVPMEVKVSERWSPSPSLLAKASSNWERRKQHLYKEHFRFSLYLSILLSSH